MGFCTNCGAPLGQSEFCSACGAGQGLLPTDSQSRRSGPGWFAWVAMGALGLLLGGGALLLLFTRSGSGGDVDAAAATTLPQPAPIATVTENPTPTPAVTVTVNPTPTPTVTVTKESGGNPGSDKDCGSSVYAGGTASCPFALSVAEAFRDSGGNRFLEDVYSPVTGLYYDLTCSGQAPVTCVVGRARVSIY